MDATIDLQDDSLIDQIKLDRVGQFQVLILAIGALVLFCDGFDAQMMSFVAPALAKDWALGPAELGPVFAANLTGLMVGAALCAPLADVISRKSMLLVCVAFFGVSTLLVPFIHSIPMLLVLRLVTGLSMGAAQNAAGRAPELQLFVRYNCLWSSCQPDHPELRMAGDVLDRRTVAACDRRRALRVSSGIAALSGASEQKRRTRSSSREAGAGYCLRCPSTTGHNTTA
jgi:hypothetical protein